MQIRPNSSDLSALLEARHAYERSFGSLPIDLETVIERLPDHDLLLAGHVVIVNAAGRRFQITLDDTGPTAFFQQLGASHEVAGLQIVVEPGNLQTESCRTLFNEWIVTRATEEDLAALLSKFG